MASTRYPNSMIQIYQDPPTYDYDSAPMPTSKRSSASKPTPPLRAALKDAPGRRNIVFTPPFAEMSGRKPSPLKSSQRLSSPLSSSPSRRPFSSKFNMVSMPPPQSSISHTDSIEKRVPEKYRNGPHKALFTTFMTERPEDKENMNNFYPSHYNNQSTKAEFPIDMNYGQKGMNKRTLMDAAPIQESSRPFKKPKSSTSQLSQNDHFPLLPDDGKKPAHSYAQLIGMAILRAPNQRLTLAQIYKWISDTYSFYSPNLAGWQNSIRHNLSLNKAFVKQERPKDDPGKGNYWAIAPGTENQFFKGKHGGGKAMTVENSAILTPALTPVTQPAELESHSFNEYNPVMPELPAPSSYVPEQLAPAPELSSDATIPASDAFIPEEEPMPPPPNKFLASSPPPQINSSPPVSHHSARDDTPPPVPPFPTSSALRSHKRGVASMDDSGYFSALSSSAIRPQKNRAEADREHTRFKSRGRAEEEIARLRGSSYDSPSKSITRPSRSVGFSQNRLDSSPVRRGQKSNNDSSQMLPPLTPAVKFKAPERPPPSVSPNANLRLHRQSVRELIGSPLRVEENLPWSPEFNLDEESYLDMFSNSNLGFDIYADADASNDNFNINAIQANILNGSPEKKELRKPRTMADSGRSKSGGALGDITNVKLSSNNLFAGAKSANSTPLLKYTPQLAPHPNLVGNENAVSPSKSYGFSNQLNNSPSKPSMPTGLSSPSKMFSSLSPSKSLFSNPMMDMGYGSAATGGFDLALAGDDWAGDDFLVNDFNNSANNNMDNNSKNTVVDQENTDPSTNNGGGFEGGLDLLGGFQRIGSGVANSRNGAPSASAAVTSFNAALSNAANGRPSMGRSFTTRF